MKSIQNKYVQKCIKKPTTFEKKMSQRFHRFEKHIFFNNVKNRVSH
jgi:hypothetical protein